VIRWTGLAPWEFDFPFPGSLTSTFLEGVEHQLVLLGPRRGVLLLLSPHNLCQTERTMSHFAAACSRITHKTVKTSTHKTVKARFGPWLEPFCHGVLLLLSPHHLCQESPHSLKPFGFYYPFQLHLEKDQILSG